MNDACTACRAIFEKLQADGKDVVLGCEWCGAKDADSVVVGLQADDGHETIISIEWPEVEGE